jgi:hypothetical protein
MEMLARSKIHTEVEYVEEKQPLGSGGFRKTFKATSRHKDFAGRIWVIEHYLPEALKCIADTGQTVEGIARNFAMQITFRKSSQ